MTWKEWSDTIIAFLKLVVSWPVFVFILFLVFRKQVSMVLLGIRRFSKEGIEIAPQPGTATTAKRAEEVLSTAGNQAVEDLLRAFDSPVARENALG